MTEGRFRRVLLVGFMGAGKTSVGRSLATSLGWRFEDMDDAVETAVGLSVAEIFARHGEAAFREAESDAAARLLLEDQVVIASGGGWAASPGRLDALPEGTASVWLEVGPAQAVRRVSEQAGQRPLLEGPDPEGAAHLLLAERASAYAAARWRVDTEGRSVEDVSARILRLVTGIDPEEEPE